MRHTRQPFVQTIPLDKQLLVVQTEQMQNRCVPVFNADLVLDRRKSEIVGTSQHKSLFHSATCHPRADGVLVMVAARLGGILVTRQLRNRQPPHFSAPEDQSFVQ